MGSKHNFKKNEEYICSQIDRGVRVSLKPFLLTAHTSKLGCLFSSKLHYSELWGSDGGPKMVPLLVEWIITAKSGAGEGISCLNSLEEGENLR